MVASLWAPETYLKFLFLGLTSFFWWPLARAMYEEILPALNASDATPRLLPPGQDPFLNIPLASHRARRNAEGVGRSSARVTVARAGLRRRTL